MGGIIAAVFTTLRPMQVRELILLAPAGAMAPPMFSCFRYFQAWMRLSPKWLMPLVAKVTADPPPTPEDYCGPSASAYHEQWE